MFDDGFARPSKVKKKAMRINPLKEIQNRLPLNNISSLTNKKTDYKVQQITKKMKNETKKSFLEASLLEHILPTPKKTSHSKQKAAVKNAQQQQQQQRKYDSLSSTCSHMGNYESVPRRWDCCEVHVRQHSSPSMEILPKLKTNTNVNIISIRDQKEVYREKGNQQFNIQSIHDKREIRQTHTTSTLTSTSYEFPIRLESNNEYGIKFMRSLDTPSKLPTMGRTRTDISPYHRDRIEESRENGILEQDKAYGTEHPIARVPVISQRVPDRIEMTREKLQTDLGGSDTHIENRCLPVRSEMNSEVTSGVKREKNTKMNLKQISACQVSRTKPQLQSNITNMNMESPAATKLDRQRTVRLLYAKEFDELRLQSSEYVKNLLVENNIVKSILPSSTKNNLRFVLRLMPLSDFEVERGDFKIVEAPEESSTAVALYEASTLPDLKTLDLKAHLFQFDAVFSDKVSFEDIYIRSGVQDLVVRSALKGDSGTIIIFGDDKYGKSNTTSDMFERAGFDIFSNTRKSNCSISVKYLGLNSNRCIDLLGPVKSEGGYQTSGVVEANILSTKEILDTLFQAKERLLKETILRGESEINSYLLCQIMIRNGDGEAGCLSLLVCPCGDGMHRALEIDTDSANKEIKSLAHIMDITRSLASSQNRLKSESQCSLTKLLTSSITRKKEFNICLVAALSSSSADTEVTLKTMILLKNEMNGNLRRNKNKELCEKASYEENDLILPRQWSKIQLLNWLTKKHLVTDEPLDSSEKLCGKCVMQMTKQQLKDSFYYATEDANKKASKLFAALRGENDRIARFRVKRKFALQKAKK
jgi:hypothetical protein